MTERERLNPLPYIEVVALLGAVSLFAFTQRQKDWIKERDGNKCQATVKHKCNETEHPLEVDHVLIPQRYGAKIGVPEEFIDRPENALTKCRNAHDIKHPDRVPIRREYHKDKGAFKKMFEERAEKLNKRQTYWNTENDRLDAIRAIQLTAKYVLKGHVWPLKRQPKK